MTTLLHSSSFSVATDTTLNNYTPETGEGFGVQASSFTARAATDLVENTNGNARRAVTEDNPTDPDYRVTGFGFTFGGTSSSHRIGVQAHGDNANYADATMYELNMRANDGWRLQRWVNGSNAAFVGFDTSYVSDNSITASTVIDLRLQVERVDADNCLINAWIRLDGGTWDQILTDENDEHGGALDAAGNGGFYLQTTDTRLDSFVIETLGEPEPEPEPEPDPADLVEKVIILPNHEINFTVTGENTIEFVWPTDFLFGTRRVRIEDAEGNGHERNIMFVPPEDSLYVELDGHPPGENEWQDTPKHLGEGFTGDDGPAPEDGQQLLAGPFPQGMEVLLRADGTLVVEDPVQDIPVQLLRTDGDSSEVNLTINEGESLGTSLEIAWEGQVGTFAAEVLQPNHDMTVAWEGQVGTFAADVFHAAEFAETAIIIDEIKVPNQSDVAVSNASNIVVALYFQEDRPEFGDTPDATVLASLSSGGMEVDLSTITPPPPLGSPVWVGYARDWEGEVRVMLGKSVVVDPNA
jgi:hypothetical protein